MNEKDQLKIIRFYETDEIKNKLKEKEDTSLNKEEKTYSKKFRTGICNKNQKFLLEKKKIIDIFLISLYFMWHLLGIFFVCIHTYNYAHIHTYIYMIRLP